MENKQLKSCMPPWLLGNTRIQVRDSRSRAAANHSGCGDMAPPPFRLGVCWTPTEPQLCRKPINKPPILRTSHGITPAIFISTRRTTVHRHVLPTPYCIFRNITCQKQPERAVHATRWWAWLLLACDVPLPGCVQGHNDTGSWAESIYFCPAFHLGRLVSRRRCRIFSEKKSPRKHISKATFPNRGCSALS